MNMASETFSFEFRFRASYSSRSFIFSASNCGNFYGNSKRFVLVGNAVEQKDGKKIIDDTKFHLFEFVHDVEEVPNVIPHILTVFHFQQN
jgi:hypothetical protein